MRLHLFLAAALCLVACGGDDATSGAGGVPGAGGAGASGATGGAGAGGTPTPGVPSIGAHGLSFFRVGDNPASIDSPALATQPSGGTIVVSVGRGDAGAFALPSDNKGNQPYQQLGSTHNYTSYPGSGTAVYAFTNALGGAGHVVSNTTPPSDEITLAVVEVAGGTRIQDQQWTEVPNGDPLTSATVTTTGRATLVAFWWGDAGVDSEKTAVPDNGFQVLDSVGESGALVQCFVAAREVDEAGSYQVTWTATPVQGAQLWLVAVE